MENINFNTYDEIVQYLDSINAMYNQESKKLNDITIGVFEIKGKKTKEDQRRELKRSLISYVKTYEYYDRFLRDATTFRRQDMVRFLVDYFSIVYGKKYVSLNGVSDRGQYYSVILYDLIISERDLEKVNENNNENKIIDFKELFDRCEDCCLLVGDSLKLTLLDGKDLSSDFEDFPELVNAAKILVSLKLSHPEMSDQKRLLTILNNSCLEFNEVSHSLNNEVGHKLGKTYPDNK